MRRLILLDARPSTTPLFLPLIRPAKQDRFCMLLICQSFLAQMLEYEESDDCGKEQVERSKSLIPEPDLIEHRAHVCKRMKEQRSDVAY